MFCFIDDYMKIFNVYRIQLDCRLLDNIGVKLHVGA